MGLFDDTIRDAHRPVAGAGIRRRTAAHRTEVVLPDESATEDELSGMQTIFRFQKAESPALPGGLQKAPYQSETDARLLAGDPSSASAGGASPGSLAEHVGSNGVTLMSHRRTGDLETGRDEHTSPGGMAPATASFGLATVQPVAAAVPVKTESHGEQQSSILQGSAHLAGRDGDAYVSGPAGRGAPSETSSPIPAATPGDTPSFAPGATRRPAERGSLPGAAESLDLPEMVRSGASPIQKYVAGVHRSAPDVYGRTTPVSPTTGHVSRVPETAQSNLVIGRINVVVVAGNSQPQSSPRLPSDSGFLSRNYLKRL